jgi:hypothetical protein
LEEGVGFRPSEIFEGRLDDISQVLAEAHKKQRDGNPYSTAANPELR